MTHRINTQFAANYVCNMHGGGDTHVALEDKRYSVLLKVRHTKCEKYK